MAAETATARLNRIPVAKAGNKVLYYDEIPVQLEKLGFTGRQHRFDPGIYK